MADRIVVLNAGRVEQFGTPMELYHHPATKFVAQFIGQPNMNFMAGEVTGIAEAGVTVAIDGGPELTLPVAPGSARVGDLVEVGIRPEDVEIGAGGLKLSVNVLERLGGTSITYGTLPGSAGRFCAALDGTAPVREGETVELTMDPASAHVFDAQGRVLRRLAAPALAA